MKISSSQAKTLLVQTLRANGGLMVNKQLIKTIGLIPAIILSNYLEKQIYFDNNHPENEGWFYLKHKHIAEELCLKEFTIAQAKKKLLELSVIQVEKRGLPAKEWIKINYMVLLELYATAQQNPDPKKTRGQGGKKTLGLDGKKNGGHLNNTKQERKPKKEILNYIVATNVATESDCKETPFFPLVERLENLVSSKHKIKVTPQKRKAWAKSLRLLVEIDGIPIDRMENALAWYEEHHDEDFVPVIESGKSFREKFLRLESAIERPKRKRNTNGKKSYRYTSGNLKISKSKQVV